MMSDIDLAAVERRLAECPCRTGFCGSWNCYTVRRLVDEVRRLRRGDFAAEEIHNICHNLHGTVNAQASAAGCAEEQRKLYGCAPDADEVRRLREQNAALAERVAAQSELLSRRAENTAWTTTPPTEPGWCG